VRTPLAVAALACIVLAAGLGAPPAAIAARGTDLPQMSADPIPTPTPIFNLAAPPLSVGSPSAVDSCADDSFLAARSVPEPWEQEVTVCGRVIDAPAGLTRGGPRPAFAVDVDGTKPIAVIGAPNGNPGDTVVVHGRYHRDKSGADWIDRVTQTVSRAWSQPGYVILNGTTYQ